MASQQEDKAPDMSEEEVKVLLDEYEKNKGIIDSDEKTVDFGRKKKVAWEEITEALNACGSFKRTVSQVKTKMKNLKTRAKTRYLATKKGCGTTGGGPPPKQLSVADERLFGMYGGSAGWSGVPGGALSSVIPPFEEDTPTTLPNVSFTEAEETPDTVTASTTHGTTDVTYQATTPVRPREDRTYAVRDIRQLQVRALESQIKANEAVVTTCNNINNVLIPNLLAKLGSSPEVLTELCNLLP